MRYAVAADNPNVLVIEKGAATDDCDCLGPVSVEDGYACRDCENPYEGDRERALRRLKSRVALRGGNTLLFEDFLPGTFITHTPGFGIRAVGVAYRCPRSR